jgi:hypothetical protein
MNDSNSREANAGFYSLDCVDVWFDGPGDKTVRPLTGKLLELALAERERMAKWEAWYKQQLAAAKIPDDIDVVGNGPGDTTIRPLTGTRLEQAKAERERIAYWEAWKKQQQSGERPTDPKDAKNGP